MDGKPSVLLVSAEASSNIYAVRLLENFRRQNSGVEFFGVGSPEMERLGFRRIGKSEEMAVVGIVEVIEHFPLIKQVFRGLVEAAKEKRPRVVILMDYPDFNLRLAAEMKKLGIPVVYYISPQVWAWRKGRVHKIKKLCDKVLVVFPFEKEFYESYGVPCEFVGHPLLDEIRDHTWDENRVRTERERRGWMKNDFVVGLMPGSRKGELALHLDLQIDAATELVRRNPRVRICFIVAPTFDREAFVQKLERVSFPYLALQEEPLHMIQMMDALLAASGTATLQIGLLQKPMVVMYKFKPLTYWLGKMVVHGLKYFGIVNIIFNDEVVPERLQSAANVQELVRLMEHYIQDPKEIDRVSSRLATLPTKLGSFGVTERVVKQIEGYLK